MERDIIKTPCDFSNRLKSASMLSRIVFSKTVSDSGEKEFQRHASSKDIFKYSGKGHFSNAFNIISLCLLVRHRSFLFNK